MPSRSRSSHALTCGVLLAVGACAPASTEPAKAPVRAEAHARRVLVVTIVVDQLAAWIAEARFPELPKSGGFARLAREGTYVRALHYAHAVTDTAPGHAALFTGAPPRGSGIFANERVDEALGKRVSILRDDATRLLAPAGAPNTAGSSIARLRVPTLADAFRAAYKDAAIVSVSLKDRGAIFGGGRTPTATLWFDPTLDSFVTSTAFARAFPPWATPHATQAELARGRATPWTPLDDAWVKRHAATPDAQPGEGDLEGLGTTFPHDVATSHVPAVAFRATPFADEAVLALALAAVDGERMATRPALLAISLSANDYVGHVFGPDSWEAWDELLRLDAALARFFAALDTRVGPDGYAVLLSGDHGTTTMPEAGSVPAARPWCAGPNESARAPARAEDPWGRACGLVGRLLQDDLARELRAAAQKALGDGAWVLGVADPFVHYTTAALALDAPRRRTLDGAMRDALLAHPEVDRVIDVRELPAVCPPIADASIDALLCRSATPDVAAAALYVLPKRGSFFDPGYTPGKGMSHGSPYLYDRAVPLLVRAPGRVAAGRVVAEAAPVSSYARTAAALLGVPPPEGAANGRNFSEGAKP